MIQQMQEHPAAQRGLGPFELKRGHGRARTQAHRTMIGLGLLALSLLAVTILGVMQDADEGLWWPLVAWTER